jgi:hypothetical protein
MWFFWPRRRRMARHDVLTGLANRTVFAEALQKPPKVRSGLYSLRLTTWVICGLKSRKKQKQEHVRNVIMEMGMLLASLTRKRCAILTKGFIELPSNMGGVITIPFNDHVREAVPKLVQRLQDAGFKLDASAIGVAQG